MDIIIALWLILETAFYGMQTIIIICIHAACRQYIMEVHTKNTGIFIETK